MSVLISSILGFFVALLVFVPDAANSLGGFFTGLFG